MQKTTDWTFQTPYKGHVHLFKDYKDNLFRDLKIEEQDKEFILSKMSLDSTLVFK